MYAAPSPGLAITLTTNVATSTNPNTVLTKV